MTEKKPLMFRLPQEVIDKLKAEATAQHRSVNNLLEVIIAEYLQKKNIEKR